MEQTDGAKDFLDEEAAETGAGDKAANDSGDTDTGLESGDLDILIEAEADRLVRKYGDKYSGVAFGVMLGLSNDETLFGVDGRRIQKEDMSKWGIAYKTKVLEGLMRL